jgi:hypothetical protein
MRKTSGISLMLLIFLSLCLITFSLLSLSGAAADRNLSQKLADRTTEYYRADTQANEVLSIIDQALAGYLRTAASGSQSESQNEAAYLELCSNIAADLEGQTDGTELSWEDGTISYQIAVNDDQLLCVTLQVDWPTQDDDSLYRITSWQLINTADWNPDTTQNVLRLN